jgi:hypothetical protein
MSELIDLAESVMATHGWTTRREPEVARAHLHFDLIAENEVAIVFFDSVPGSALRDRAEALSAAVAAVTLQESAGVKAWEAYLVLVVSEGYIAADADAQAVQRDLSYCRKVVIDGEGIAAAIDSRRQMEAALSFLFPLDVASVPRVDDVRQHLIQFISEKGYDRALVTALVNAFDTEADCRCWGRINEFQRTRVTE